MDGNSAIEETIAGAVNWGIQKGHQALRAIAKDLHAFIGNRKSARTYALQ